MMLRIAELANPKAQFCNMTACLAISNQSVAKAVTILAAGQLVAFPTETVYGLGADHSYQPLATTMQRDSEKASRKVGFSRAVSMRALIRKLLFGPVGGSPHAEVLA